MIEPPLKVQEVSVGENPEPDTETMAPAEADEGLSVIAEPITVKVVEAESPAGLPIVVIE